MAHPRLTSCDYSWPLLMFAGCTKVESNPVRDVDEPWFHFGILDTKGSFCLAVISSLSTNSATLFGLELIYTHVSVIVHAVSNYLVHELSDAVPVLCPHLLVQLCRRQITAITYSYAAQCSERSSSSPVPLAVPWPAGPCPICRH